jgi:hypothetical protein
VQLADSFPIDRTFYGAGAENPGRLLQQLLLPTGNLVYVNVILCRQLRQRLLALDGVQSHSGLECR